MQPSHSDIYSHQVYIPTKFVAFLDIALWSFNKLHDHVTYKNDIWEYKKRVIINHMTYRNGIISFAYAFQPSSVIVVFVKVVI